MIMQKFDIRNCEVKYLVVKVPTDLVMTKEDDHILLNGEETVVRGKAERGPYTYLVVDS